MKAGILIAILILKTILILVLMLILMVIVILRSTTKIGSKKILEMSYLFPDDIQPKSKVVFRGLILPKKIFKCGSFYYTDARISHIVHNIHYIVYSMQYVF